MKDPGFFFLGLGCLCIYAVFLSVQFFEKIDQFSSTSRKETTAQHLIGIFSVILMVLAFDVPSVIRIILWTLAPLTIVILIYLELSDSPVTPTYRKSTEKHKPSSMNLPPNTIEIPADYVAEKLNAIKLEAREKSTDERSLYYEKLSEVTSNPSKKEALRDYLASHGYKHETDTDLYESTWVLKQRVDEPRRKNEAMQYVNEINKNLKHNLMAAELEIVQAELNQNLEKAQQLWQTIDSKNITSEQRITLLQQYEALLDVIASSRTKLLTLQQKGAL